jgi:hypothetical protein
VHSRYRFRVSQVSETYALDMTVNRCTMAFKDATTPTFALSPTVIGRKLRGFGIDLALTDPNILFLHHEWISDTHLRPQLHANAWLGAVSIFGPLYQHHERLGNEVIQAMNTAEDDATGGLDQEDEDDEEVHSEEPRTVGVLPPSPKPSRKKKKTIAEFLNENVSVAASAATAPAGAANLHQRKISGKDRKFQLRYDIRLDVSFHRSRQNYDLCSSAILQ